MITLNTYLSESILSSTHSGANFYFDKLIVGADACHLMKFPNCDKSTLIVSYKSQSSNSVTMRTNDSKLTNILNSINGILIEDKKGNLKIPGAYKLIRTENCEIDLSSWNFGELLNNASCAYNYITFTFFYCKNIDVVGMPKFSNELLPSIDINTSIINSFCKLPNKSIVKIAIDNKGKYFTDASIFKDSNLLELTINEQYLHRDDKLYNAKVFDGFGSALKQRYTPIVNELFDLGITNTIKLYFDFLRELVWDEPTQRYIFK